MKYCIIHLVSQGYETHMTVLCHHLCMYTLSGMYAYLSALLMIIVTNMFPNFKAIGCYIFTSVVEWNGYRNRQEFYSFPRGVKGCHASTDTAGNSHRRWAWRCKFLTNEVSSTLLVLGWQENQFQTSLRNESRYLCYKVSSDHFVFLNMAIFPIQNPEWHLGLTSF